MLSPRQFDENEDILQAIGGGRQHVSRMSQEQLEHHIVTDHSKTLTRESYKKILGPKPHLLRSDVEARHEQQHLMLSRGRGGDLTPHKHGPA